LKIRLYFPHYVQTRDNQSLQPVCWKHRQFPVTPAYAFTDYRSQGQTIPHSAHRGLSLFNLYVALSRSSGRSTVRLLRDFDAKVFLAAHSAELIAEDDRLRELDTETKKQWELMGRGPTALTHR
ncbi:hypothetical protein SCLCIDRAFT_1221915, partial [Scleroderma citrinum Foug A]